MSGPDLFTIAEVAAILRIGRTTAYELAARDLATGGGEGLGAVRVGNQLRVRRTSLEAMIGGPLSWPVSAGPARSSNVVRLAAVPERTEAPDSSLVEPWSEPSLPSGS